MADKRVPARRMMPKWLTFVIGAASGMMAISAVQPADLLKSRMQLVGPAGRNLSAFAVARDIVRNEGVIGNMGLSAALYRQATYNYSTGHLGCFNDMYDMYKATHGNLSLSKKVAMGVVAQGVRAFMGNSTEVAFVSMPADCKLPPQETRKYMNVIRPGRCCYRLWGTARRFLQSFL
ncbi:hypothetical protein B5X24_HaOG213394 [Helicoverpa armigera]|nr:hypothetical protein B5X24_HaOG213394 [Helicoverpa armigera]